MKFLVLSMALVLALHTAQAGAMSKAVTAKSSWLARLVQSQPIVQKVLAGGAIMALCVGLSSCNLTVTVGDPYLPPILYSTSLSAVNDALVQAATQGNTKYLQRSLATRKDIDVNTITDSDGTPLLSLAVMMGHTDTAALLLAEGADANLAVDGYTSLHFAGQYGGDAEIATLLIENGADVNLVDDGGLTPLHTAASRSNVAVATVLIANGADVDARDNWQDLLGMGDTEGMTPLHRAVLNWWSYSSAQFAMGLAEGSGYSVSDEVRRVNDSYKDADPRGMVDLLLNSGVNVNVRSENGRTPLHVAAKYGIAEAVKHLRNRGASIYAKDNEGNTPAMLAEYWGNTNVLRELQRD